MARANLEAIIERVRSLTGADDSFTADEIQAALDATRSTHRYLPLYGEDLEGSDPIVWHAFHDTWEDGYELVDSDYVAVAEATSGDVSEPLLGRFVLAASNGGPILISGRTYDLNAACAEILTSWAAKEARSFDFSADGQSFSRSQKREALLELAAEFRKRVKPAARSLYRPDEES